LKITLQFNKTTFGSPFQVISYNTYTGPYAIDDGEGKWKLYSQSGETCKWQHSKYDGEHSF